MGTSSGMNRTMVDGTFDGRVPYKYVNGHEGNIEIQFVDLYNLTRNFTANSSALLHGSDPTVGLTAIVGLSLLFCIVGVVGIVGNTLVIFIVLTDRKMRNSVTNLFIMNLALSDLLIMLFGVPEIVMFMINRGWLLGDALCKTQRYVLVCSVYSSVVTLVAVCVERYIAIVHPIQAHIFCSRRRMMIVIGCIWPCVLLCGLPVALFNQLKPMLNMHFCITRFPGNHFEYIKIFKYLEFVLFYLIPMILQVTCYIIIAKHLFAGTEELHRKQFVRTKAGTQKEKSSDAIKARKGVIKMLIASVTIYFISYSPHQVLLFYNTFSRQPFHTTWVFLVFVTAMGYVNSAANPVLYCIFSQNFRRKFRSVLMGPCFVKNGEVRLQMQNSTTDFTGTTRYTRVPLRMSTTGV